MSPRFHPLVRLCIAAVGIVMAAICVFAVIIAALTTAAKSSGKSATDFVAFFNANALLLQILFYAPALLVLWACRRLLDRQSFRSLGLRTRGFFASFSSGALAASLTLSLLFGTLWMCGQIHINGFSVEYSKSNFALSLLTFALFFFAVGFFEEVVFRGYALHNLTAWLGVKGAIAVQALVFGLIHLANIGANVGTSAANGATSGATLTDARWGIVNIALIGVFFALAYLKSGSLWFPIGFHAAWDFALGCVFSLPVSGLPVVRVLDVTVAPSFITGGTFGLEGSILLTPLILALCAVVSQLPNHAQAERDLSFLRTAKQIARDEEIAAQSVEATTSHLSNIRASMRPNSPSPQLDLRGLNTMNPAPRTPSFEIFTPASTPETIAATSSTRSDVSPAFIAETKTPETVSESFSSPTLASELIAAQVEPKVDSAPKVISESAFSEVSRESAPVEVIEKPSEVFETNATLQAEAPVSEPVVEAKPKPKKPAPKW